MKAIFWTWKYTAAGAISAAWLATAGALGQQDALVSTWTARVPGQPFPIEIRLQILPAGQFQQDLQSGSDACGHVMTVGKYRLLQSPNTYRFDISDQVPKIDCLGHPIVQQL